MNCSVLMSIRYKRALAFACRSFAEFDFRVEEEEKHVEKCPLCRAQVKPLYLELWPNAKIGVDIYA
jgi:hypothetical protein